MTSKTIVLGISGGIAAYKTPELVRQLTGRGYRVIPVLTAASKEFVTVHTLAAVSGETVRDDLWDRQAEHAMGHIELARLADVLVVAPATANTIAKFTHGQSDDLLSTVYTATTAPTLVAPAMNQQMYEHVATQRNLAQLVADGVHLIGPRDGEQACGEVGPGRMSEPEEIADEIDALLGDASSGQTGKPRYKKGSLRAVVTAGPTREPIDPVRYLSNASSGRQGFAIAEALQRIGAEVTLVSGPVSLETPKHVHRIDVTTAEEMHGVVLNKIPSCDLLFAVAAVADYRPDVAQSQKIKKSSLAKQQLQLNLIETEDIVRSVAKLPNRPFMAGFAAETENVLENARQKRERKGLDVIVLNDVSKREIGFDSSHNAVTLIHAGGEVEIPYANKSDVADQIVSQVVSLLQDERKRELHNGSDD